MELDGYSRPTCNKRCAFSHDALDRRTCDPQARPSTSSVDHTIDLPWVQSLGQSYRGKYRYFWKYPNFHITQCKVGQKESSLAENHLCPSSLYDAIPACDGQTDGQTHDSTYRASIASCGKKTFYFVYTVKPAQVDSTGTWLWVSTYPCFILCICV